MTAITRDNRARSRRALLAGALGGIGAWVAAAAARVDPAAAAAGDPIRMGRLNRAEGTSTELRTKTSKPAFRAVQLGGGAAVRGEAGSGRGVMGVAGRDGTGVFGHSVNHFGVVGMTDNKGAGVYGEAGISNPSGRGVWGLSEVGSAIFGETVSGTGVRGKLVTEAAGNAVLGEVSGAPFFYESAAIRGTAPGFAWAGRFDGEVQISKNLQLLPSTTPDVQDVGVTGARVFVRENVSGKSELCVIFPSGAAQVIATEP